MKNAALQEVLDKQSVNDENALVNLPNHRYVMSLLKASLRLAKKKNKVLLVLYFSLNNLGQINDVYGKDVGDSVLEAVTERLAQAIQKGDHSLYLGGNKYLTFLSIKKEKLAEAELLIENLKRLITKPVNIGGYSLKMGVKLGIAAYPMQGDKAGVLLNIAEFKKHRVNQEPAERNETIA